MNSQYRCETCDYRCDKKDGIKCPYDKEDVYYLLKEEMSFPRGSWLFTSVVGCASHSDFQSEREKVLDELNAEWMRLCSLPIMHLEKFSMIGDKIAELRQEGESEDEP